MPDSVLHIATARKLAASLGFTVEKVEGSRADFGETRYWLSFVHGSYRYAHAPLSLAGLSYWLSQYEDLHKEGRTMADHAAYASRRIKEQRGWAHQDFSREYVKYDERVPVEACAPAPVDAPASLAPQLMSLLSTREALEKTRAINAALIEALTDIAEMPMSLIRDEPHDVKALAREAIARAKRGG